MGTCLQATLVSPFMLIFYVSTGVEETVRLLSSEMLLYLALLWHAWREEARESS